ncbi:40s ribosomal s10 [Tubulinosema ratisbonensis]|uniref:40s ribosomal s10 n=1 Tax=Tubulinosema ratisbonensis TaxID=291195 RepID=A0A437AL75_9MICR|nr:40s ribosomal s10 [Tubulinosema ratisbonensis]
MKKINSDDILLMKKHLLEKQGIVVEDTDRGNHFVLDIKNLDVMCFCKSLVGKGLATKTHTWKHSYYFLTPAGVAKLREELSQDAILSIDANVNSELVDETNIIN